MSRRFSDEPINLIHRIPTPEQLSAVRPQKRSLTHMMLESGAACIRRLVEACASVARVGRLAETIRDVAPTAGSSHDASTHGLTPDSLNEATVTSSIAPVSQAGILQPWEDEMRVQGSMPEPVAIQGDEVAELRAYLLTQQQDIARLSAQLQELKSLVASQQQVLVYMGKDLEMNSLSPMTGGVASASGKRHRPAREKASMKDKTVPQKDLPKPKPPSLSL